MKDVMPRTETTDVTESTRLLGNTSDSTGSTSYYGVEVEEHDGCNIRARLVSGVVLVLTM